MNCYNIINGDVQCIRSSFAKNPGNIVGEKHENLAHFFGYSPKDFFRIENIT